jgi:hypothetical protein
MLLVEPSALLLESFLEAARQHVADEHMATLVSADLNGLNADPPWRGDQARSGGDLEPVAWCRPALTSGAQAANGGGYFMTS